MLTSAASEPRDLGYDNQAFNYNTLQKKNK